MSLTAAFFINAVAFGVGLAMDAFSVSMANGLNEPKMSKPRMCLIAGTFCGFQTLMPLVGWLCIHTIAEAFEGFQKFIPWIALILLAYIGGKMLIEGIRDCKASRGGSRECESEMGEGLDSAAGQNPAESGKKLGLGLLMIQGIATAIDALSVGFTIASYDFAAALIEALIIGIVTFVICMGGLTIGKKVGDKLSGKASILGGIILVAIGLEIFITSF